MRRSRPHRLTGSVQRLLSAALLAGLAAAFAVMSTPRPASAAGVGLNLDLGLGVVSVGLPTGLPPLPPTPSGATPPPAPSTSAPSLPGGAALPVVCPPSCATNGAVASRGGAITTAPGRSQSGTPTGSSGRAALGSSSPFGSSRGSGSSATSTVTVPQSVGLAVSPPPPVEQLTPLAGISFGQAPYLWPLFILLDVVAAAAVVLLVRRTWSPTSGGD